ncbi:MAG: AzlC family ABC transporter permease [Anaerolineales bacterium]|nr:AzlC family ABC transporter permease [Anaerolineales bacterium]
MKYLEEMMKELHPAHTRKAEFYAGAKATFPLIVGAIPFGIIFGALASTTGLSSWATQAMSLFVFAGSAQFIAATLISGGSGVLLIIFTTLVVNLRHMLYAATVSPHVRYLPQKWLLPLGFWLTDESFVAVIQRYRQADDSPNKHWFFLGSAVFMYTNWQASTFIGILAGQRIEDPLKWGLDFAMIVTFIGMTMPMLNSRSTRGAALASGVTAFLLRGLPNKLGLVIAALAGIGAGMLLCHLLKESREVAHDAPE